MDLYVWAPVFVSFSFKTQIQGRIIQGTLRVRRFLPHCWHYAYDLTPCSQVRCGMSSCEIHAVSAVKVGPPCWGTRILRCHFSTFFVCAWRHLSFAFFGSSPYTSSQLRGTASCRFRMPISSSTCVACTSGRWSAFETAPLICLLSFRLKLHLCYTCDP